MKEDQLITYETVKLLEKIGFSIEPYIKLGELKQTHNWHKEQLNTISVWYINITQSTLQKWLREDHSRHPVIHKVVSNGVITGYSYKGTPWDKKETYEEALEEWLQEELKLIKL